MFRWVCDNKEWLFSGVAIAISAFIFGLFRFIHRKAQQRKIAIFRSNASKLRNGVLVAKREWNQEHGSIMKDFKRAALVLSKERDCALSFWPEVFSIFGRDSGFARDLGEAADLLHEAAKRQDTLTFATFGDFWSAGEQALCKFEEILDRLLEYHQEPWYRRWFRKRGGQDEG